MIRESFPLFLIHSRSVFDNRESNKQDSWNCERLESNSRQKN